MVKKKIEGGLLIVETLYCPRCFQDAVDVVLEDRDIKVIGGCINCDYQPSYEELMEY